MAVIVNVVSNVINIEINLSLLYFNNAMRTKLNILIMIGTLLHH